MTQSPPAPPPSDLPPALAPMQEPPASPIVPRGAGGAQRRWLATAIGAVLVLALAAAGLVGYLELARSLEATRAQVTAAREDMVAEAARATRIAREVEARVDDLGRALELVRAQRAALDQLYLELARGRDEATLLDVERLVTLAAQDLRFTGHVASALSAMQAADARLARLDRPQYLGLRRALARDIDRLRSVPVIDLTGIALKLDQVAAAIDGIALLSEPAARPARVPEAQAPAAAPARAPTTWEKVRAWLADEFGDLVRIREVETPDALLLTGMQQRLVRSQFRLRLLDARQALLGRNEKIFRADLTEALALLTRYFDVKSAGGGATLLQLRQLAQSNLSVDIPNLDESLHAIRATRPIAAPALAR